MDTNLNAKANGIGSIALGGFRGDKLNGIPDQLPENDKNTTEIADIDTITVVDGIQAAAFGAGNRAYGNWNFIAGKDNKTFQKGSFAFGGKNAVGNPAEPDAYCYSIAVGESNTVSGRSCFVGGASNESKNNAQYGITYGSNNNSEGIASIVVGSYITMSHVTTAAAFGGEHIVNNSCAFVSGVGNKTDGYGSTALGGYLTTNTNYQAVVGVLNKPNPDAMFVVGNGTNVNNPKNIFEVLKDGRAKVHKAPEEDNDVVRKLELEESWSNFNIENGEGSGAIQQTGYTLEGVHNDFKHYAAAYGIAVAQGLEGVEAVEQLMSTYSYEQLLSMIAQANFGGNTSQAEQYIYGMIDQILSDQKLEFIPNEVSGPASTALGVGNKIEGPVAATIGYGNTVGRKGSPLQGACSGTVGRDNVNNGLCSLEFGYGLTNEGLYSLTGGSKSYTSPSNFEYEMDKDNVRHEFENLKTHKLIESYTDDSKWYLDGNHSDSSNICFNGHISENAGSDNLVVGRSTISKGFQNTVFGQQNVVSGYRNFVYGMINNVYSDPQNNLWNNPSESLNYCMHNIVFGAHNDLGSETSVYGTWMNILVGQEIDAANSRYNNIQGNNIKVGDNRYNESSVTHSIIKGSDISAYDVSYSIISGENLKATTRRHATILGKYNVDNRDAIFEIGNGTSDTNRKNAFEVLKDGRAKILGAPKDDDDVVRLAELKAVQDALIYATDEDIDSLWS